ncbi:MAG: hypothetical protein K2P20_02430 [Oscillospiraceae bacterium]|nr:hypothetical protein [Oscillospiraceae bacterium]
MFLERLLSLCSANGTDISNVLRSLGLSTSKGTAWRNGSIPNGEILLKLANYFHVSTDYLLGNTDDPRPAGAKEVGPPAAVSKPLYPPEYNLLTPEDKILVDNMIRSLAKKKSSD